MIAPNSGDRWLINFNVCLFSKNKPAYSVLTTNSLLETTTHSQPPKVQMAAKWLGSWGSDDGGAWVAK